MDANIPLTMDSDDRVDILIVDDRASDRMALCEILAGPNRNTVTAGSGPEALKRLLTKDFAVILLDVLMPTMDGFELAALVKQRDRSRHTPIIFLTAAGADVGKLYRAYSLGAVDYLYKPIDADIVRAKVSIFVELFRKDRRISRQAEALRVAERRERELQMAQLKLEIQRRYINLAEAIPQIVWTSDEDGGLNYANRRWVEYTGIPLEDSKGMGWLAALHGDDTEACAKAWNGALSSGTTYEVQCRLRRATDGMYRWHLCKAIPEFDKVGRIVAWLGTYTDFEELKQALQARDDFISVASHELRTPLTALKLRLEALSHSDGFDEKLRSRVDSALRQTVRLECLIDNLLDVSRIAAGQLELHPEPFDLEELVRDVADRMLLEAESRGSRLEISRSSPMCGHWDRLRIEQVVTNLLSNAIKYGNGNVIEISLDADGDAVKLTVKDRGVGIAATEVERIFERYERGSNRRKHGGLGMGLYITHQIVRAHGGTIQVDSVVGMGSTFNVVLPRS